MLKSKLLLLLFSSVFLSCQKKKEKSFWDDFYKVPYVISEKNKLYKDYCDSLEFLQNKYYDSLEIIGVKANDYPGNLPPPPLPYYTDNFGSGYGSVNIIFYEEKIYFHKKGFHFLGCATGLLEHPEIISFEDLNKEDFFQIKSLLDIVSKIKESRESSIDYSYHFVSISSLSDTITNSLFNSLIDSLNKVNPYFYIRRITEEEHHVLDAKTRNIPYEPKNYKWVMSYYNKPL